MPVQTARRQLGRRLRGERTRAGLTMEGVEEAGVMSRSTLHRLESGQKHVKEGEVWELCKLYRSTQDTTDQLTALAKETARTADEEDNVTAAWLQMYLDLESRCQTLSGWHGSLVHGLLQCDEYANAVIGTDNADEEVRRARLKQRAGRQNATLSRPDFCIQLVLAEGCFTQLNLGEQVMRHQLKHLKRMSKLAGVTVHLLPATTGPHPGLRGPFSILDFDDAEDPTVVYLENLSDAKYLDKTKHITQYRSAFTELQALSIPIEEYQL